MTDADKDVYNSGCEFDRATETGAGRGILPRAVPTKKRLVIETVTGYYIGNSDVLGAAYLTVGGVRHAFPWVQCGSLTSDPTDEKFYGFNHFVHLYVDGPAELQFDADGGAFTGQGNYSGGYSVSGYLVDIN